MGAAHFLESFMLLVKVCVECMTVLCVHMCSVCMSESCVDDVSEKCVNVQKMCT